MISPVVLEKKPLESLSQRFSRWRAQEMELYEDEVKLVYRSGVNRSLRAVPVEWVDEAESEARLYSSWARRIFFVSLLGLGGAVAVGLEWGTPGWLAASGFVTLALLSAVWHQLRTREATYFYHGYTGEFLFAVVTDGPDREAAARFCEALRAQVRRRKERGKMESEVATSAGAEIHHLARLREKEFITDDEFQRKKQDLLEDYLRE